MPAWANPNGFHPLLTATIAKRSRVDPHSAFQVSPTGVVSPGSFNGVAIVVVVPVGGRWYWKKQPGPDMFTVHGGSSLLHLIQPMSRKFAVFVATAVMTCKRTNESNISHIPYLKPKQSTRYNINQAFNISICRILISELNKFYWFYIHFWFLPLQET